MRFALFILLLFFNHSTRGVNVDFRFNPSNAATGLLSIAKLTAATENSTYPSGSAPLWFSTGPIAPDFQRMYIVDTEGAVPNFPVSVTVGGVTNTGGGTKWMRYDHSLNASTENAVWAFPGYPSPVTPPIINVLKFGFVKFSAVHISASQINFDHISLYSPVSILKQQIKTGLNCIVSHSSLGGGSQTGGAINITTSKIYFYELFKQSSASLVRVRLRDPDNNYAIVGESSCPSDLNEQTYVDYWGIQSAGICSGDTFWGNACIIYNATGFLDIGGTIDATRVNVATLRLQ